MSKYGKIFRVPVMVCNMVVIALMTLPAVAQSGGIPVQEQISDKEITDKKIPYRQKPNPFDFAIDVLEQEENAKNFSSKNIRPKSSKQLQNKTGRSFAKQYTKPKNMELQYSKSFGLSKKQADNILQKLQSQYGKPTSIRGNSYVWDIKNPQVGREQADIVTIIFRKASPSKYELIMDRARGEDGKATWALPRRHKPSKSGKGQKKYPSDRNKQKQLKPKEPQL